MLSYVRKCLEALLSETLWIRFQIGSTVLTVLSGSFNSDPFFFSTDHALTILSLKCWPLSLKANCVAIRGPCMSCLLRESHIVAYGSCMVTADQPLQAYSPSKMFSGCICIHISKHSPETHNLFLHSSHSRDFCGWDPWITSKVILCFLLLHVYSGCRRVPSSTLYVGCFMPSHGCLLVQRQAKRKSCLLSVAYCKLNEDTLDFFFVLCPLSASQCYDYVFALFLEMWQKHSMKSFVLFFARNFGQIMKLINNRYQGLMKSVGGHGR